MASKIDPTKFTIYTLDTEPSFRAWPEHVPGDRGEVIIKAPLGTRLADDGDYLLTHKDSPVGEAKVTPLDALKWASVPTNGFLVWDLDMPGCRTL